MGTIQFIGDKPFELITQKEPIVTAQDDTVVLTVSVFAAGTPQATQQLLVKMNLEHAQQAWAQLEPALRLARTYRKVHG